MDGDMKGRVFLLNKHDKILAEGRPRTYPSETGDEELDQMSKVGGMTDQESLLNGRPRLKPSGEEG